MRHRELFISNSRNVIGCLSCGIRLLTILSKNSEASSHREQTEKAELSTTTVHRPKCTFQSIYALIEEENTRKFQRCPAMVSKPQPARTVLLIRKVALPYMEKVSLGKLIVTHREQRRLQ